MLCWGGNAYHQLGDHNYYDIADFFSKVTSGTADTANRVYPVLVRTTSDVAVTGFLSVDAGTSFTCAPAR